MAKYGEFLYGEEKYGWARGYHVLLRAGSAPQAGVDTPIATLPDSAESAAMDMTALGLAADTDHFGSIVPFNETGFADPPAPFSLRTDGAGNPSIAPAAVTNLRATALAGGKVRVEWNYDEPNPLAVAESFGVKADTDMLGGAVAAAEHKREYRYEHKGMPDGVRTVTVTPSRAGAAGPATTAKVRADATPPPSTPLGISAA